MSMELLNDTLMELGDFVHLFAESAPSSGTKFREARLSGLYSPEYL